MDYYAYIRSPAWRARATQEVIQPRNPSPSCPSYNHLAFTITPHPRRTPMSTVAYCPNCGKPQPKSANFYQNCGAALHQAAPPVAAEPHRTPSRSPTAAAAQ